MGQQIIGTLRGIGMGAADVVPGVSGGTIAFITGAIATYQGAYAEANQLLEESARVLRQVGEFRMLADAITCLGIVARVRGKYTQAARILEEGLQISHDLAIASGYILRELGYLAIALGDYPQAQERMQESLTIFKEMGTRTSLVFPLDGLGSVARLMGDYDFLIFDTGAGISSNVTYFCSAAHETLLVATPEPTSHTDVYALIKVLFQKHNQKKFQLIIN